MTVRAFRPEEFLHRAGPWLEAREAEHNLLLGIAASRAGLTPPGGTALAGGDPPSAAWFGLVEEGDEIVMAAAMTPPYHLVVSRAPAPALVALRDHLLATDVRPTGVNGFKESAASFARLWAERTGIKARVHLNLRLYETDHVEPPAGVPGAFRLAGEPDVPALAGWCRAFVEEAVRPPEPETSEKSLDRVRRWMAIGRLGVWEDGGGSRSIAAGQRPSSHGICISGVYTPPEFRRRGYGSAVVAALTRRLLDDGRRFVCLFTDLSNPVSNSIYMKIGYRPVCDFLDHDFGPPGTP